METDNTNFLVIFRSGRLYEIEIASNALREHNIPFYLQEETSGGLKVAMPLMPTPASGVCWLMHVPEEKATEAKQLLSELPMEVSTEPDIWHFGPSEKSKQGWKIFAAFILILFFAWLIKTTFDIFI